MKTPAAKTVTTQLDPTHYAEVVKGKSIRLFGTMQKSAPVAGDMFATHMVHYSRAFVVGDIATYDSFNLVYTGIITAIGDKTVTITERQYAQDGTYEDKKKHMLKLQVFGWRNREFDAVKTAEHNSNELNYI